MDASTRNTNDRPAHVACCCCFARFGVCGEGCRVARQLSRDANKPTRHEGLCVFEQGAEPGGRAFWLHSTAATATTATTAGMLAESPVSGVTEAMDVIPHGVVGREWAAGTPAGEHVLADRDRCHAIIGFVWELADIDGGAIFHLDEQIKCAACLGDHVLVPHARDKTVLRNLRHDSRECLIELAQLPGNTERPRARRLIFPAIAVLSRARCQKLGHASRAPGLWR